MTLHDQFFMMFYMVLSGLYFGAAYETFRRVSRLWRQSVIFTYGLEVFFWLIQAAIFFYVLFLVNYGELRLYLFLSCFLGVTIYQVFFAKTYQKILNRMIHLLQKGFQLLQKLIYSVIIIPIGWLFSIILLGLTFIATLLLKVLNVIFWPIRWGSEAVFGLFSEKTLKETYKNSRMYSILRKTTDQLLKYFKR